VVFPRSALTSQTNIVWFFTSCDRATAVSKAALQESTQFADANPLQIRVDQSIVKPILSLMAYGFKLTLSLSLISLTTACSQNQGFSAPMALNSRYAEHQPSLSANGRFLAFVSDRLGGQGIFVYDLQRQQFVDLPGLNRPHSLRESPSLSATGRYIVYTADNRGQPEIELYDRATRRSQALTRSYPGWVRHPSISPEGRYISFESSREGGWNIEVLDRGNSIELDRLDRSDFNSPGAPLQP
jgi:hypothetical protein